MSKQANLWLPGFELSDGLFGDNDSVTSITATAVMFAEPADDNKSALPPAEIPQPNAPATELNVLAEECVEPEHGETGPQNVITSLVARRATASTVKRASAPWPKLTAALHTNLVGAVTKFEANVKAIQVLREIEATKAIPDAQQRDFLNRYTGWGGIKQPFDVRVHQDWVERALTLKSLLTEQEFESARESTLNAHFTPVPLIEQIWDLVQRLGFTGGRVLEPSSGPGYFLGAMPAEIAQASQATAVEIDSLSARILKTLYGHEANVIHSGMEKTQLADASFDLVIGNVPFGKYGVADLRRKYYSDWTIHNWFLGRSLDLVRPGGLVAVITSSSFMDSGNESRRNALARRAKLIGAYRLPQGMFSDIASTEVVADIIVLQRRMPGEYATAEEVDSWIPTNILLDKNGTPMRSYSYHQHEQHRVNQYWLDNPANVLGFWQIKNSQYGAKAIVDIPNVEDVHQKLNSVIAEAKVDTYAPAEDEGVEVQLHADAGEFSKMLPGSFVVVDGEVHRTTGHNIYKQPMQPARARRIAGLAGIRDTARDLLAEQNKVCASEEVMNTLRDKLNSQYDQFVAKSGFITAKQNRHAMASDPSWPLLLSLEYYDEETNTASKADIFYERTIRPTQMPTRAETPEDALAICVAELGTIDKQLIGNLLAMDGEQALQNLVTAGAVYLDPANGNYVTADEYLAGNVRDKLATAKLAGIAFHRNAVALERVIPKDLTPNEIDAIPGAVWIAETDYADFLTHLMQKEMGTNPYRKIEVSHSAAGAWSVSGPYDHGTTMTSVWGTSRANGYKLFQDLLNMADTEVKDTNGDGAVVLNAVETAQARQKQDELKDKFRAWLWTDDERAQRLVRIYNDRYNCWAIRKYDGSRLRLPGYSNSLQLRPHQLNAIARIGTGNNTMLAHVVGAGKTVTMVCGSMEMRRLGIAKKPVHAVPNHCLLQYTGEFARAYPGARILMASKEDFQKEHRKAFVARCATGNWDAIIMTHSMFERISCDEAFVTDYVKSIVADLTSSNKTRDRTAERALVRLKKDWESRLEKMQAAWKKDNLMFFNETGIDAVFYDEAHLAKNLYRISSMKRVAGLAESNSQRAFDLYLKTRQIMALRGDKEKGTVLATGTPISNSIAEANTFQRLLQPYTLKAAGLDHYDAWSAQFGRVVNSLEVSPDGSSFRMSKRYKQFVNMPELMGMIRQSWDIQTKEMLKLPTPPLVTGAHQIAVAKASDAVKEFVKKLVARAEAIRNRTVRPEEDNMLAVTGDGMRAALDMRLTNSQLNGFDPQGKVANCLESTKRLWELTSGFKGTQIIFCDLGTPTGGGFNLYADMRRRLVAMGIPDHEIAFIHEAKTDAAKSTLFAKVRAGTIRVLFGSTAKCGMGTNVQKRLYAVHHLTTPWRPSDIEQRDGRIERQGNTCEAIEIWRYVTEGTFDSYMWQTLTAKAGFISQVMSDKAECRTVEDAMMAALSYDEVKALACGNPRVREKAMIDAEILMLGLKEKQFREAVWDARNTLWELPKRLEKSREAAVNYGMFAESIRAASEKPLELVVKGMRYSNREQIENIVTLSVATLNEEKTGVPVLIGSIHGGSLMFEPGYHANGGMIVLRGNGDAKYKLGSFMRGSTIVEYLLKAEKFVTDEARDAEARVRYLLDQEPVLKDLVASEFPDTEKLAELRARSHAIAIEMGLLKDMAGSEGAAAADNIVCNLAHSLATGEQEDDPILDEEEGEECLMADFD